MDVALGILILILGVIGCIFSFKYRATFSIAKRDNNPSQSVFEKIPSSNRREQLRQASAGQTVTLLGEPERAIRASIALSEMFQQQPNAPWSKTGLVSKILELAGDIFIFKIPSKEAGKPTWLKGKEMAVAFLGKFYKGTDASPGPARIFKQNDQSNPVPQYLPKNIIPGSIWEVVDIGTFDAEVEGDSDNIYSGDRLYFVTSKEKNSDGNRWLIYLDARKGEAKGLGGLFLLEPFEPSVDVTDLM